MKLNLTCHICGESFQREAYRMRDGQKSYCSPACQSKGRQNTILITCDQCGKEFFKTPSRLKNLNFCSTECFHESKKTPQEAPPLCACGCGLPVTRLYGRKWHKYIHGHNFTGRQHSSDSRDKMSKAAKERSAELSQRIRGENNPNFKHGKTREIDSSRMNWFQRRKLRKAVIERDKNTCQRCFKVFEFSDLHIHHIDLDVTNNELTNLKTLCRWCHGKLSNVN